jgi:hypothetical protein
LLPHESNRKVDAYEVKDSIHTRTEDIVDNIHNLPSTTEVMIKNIGNTNNNYDKLSPTYDGPY